MSLLEADLCVVGGGLAGVAAALAAARNGAQVVLVQDRSVLGGNASSEIRMHVCGASCSGRRPGARESGIIDELRIEDAVRNPHGSPAMVDLLLYDKVLSEPNIKLLLDTACVGCVVEEAGGKRRIVEVRAVRTSTEQEFRIRAPHFADCSGDGRLGLEAGARFRMGREARAEYGESLAPEQADRLMLGSTILFQARRHDRPMPFTPPDWARRFTEEDLRLRAHAELDYGYWWSEWGGHLDTIADNPEIRHELLRIALGVWDHVKNHCGRRGIGAGAYDKVSEGEQPVMEDPRNWALEWVGMLPGKRESRRFVGPHVLTQQDIESGRVFDDQVAYGGWWIDIHPPMGIDDAGRYPCIHHPVNHLYSIPLRSLMSSNVANLFFAGRNMSATHVAFASTRVMATCAVMGQAVGTAAALAVPGEPPKIGRIQQALLRDGAYLIGVRNQDPADGAREAEVGASSETAEGPAALVLNGVTRATSPELHPSLVRCSNRWMSARLPAWIELRWPQARPVSEVHLTFDTGFQRELTMSVSEAFQKKMVRGPQPETVKDYRLEVLSSEGAVVERVEVRGNYLGRRVHRFAAPAHGRAVRLTVEATNGAPEARVFEVRVY